MKNRAELIAKAKYEFPKGAFYKQAASNKICCSTGEFEFGTGYNVWDKSDFGGCFLFEGEWSVRFSYEEMVEYLKTCDQF